MNLPLIIGPYHILGIVGSFLLLLLVSLYLIGRQEKGLIYFLWLLVVVLMPVIGPVAYLLKYYAARNSPGNSNA